METLFNIGLVLAFWFVVLRFVGSSSPSKSGVRRDPRRQALLSRVEAALAFLAGKSYDEMRPEDFDQARSVLRQVAEVPLAEGGLAPPRLQGMINRLEYAWVQKLVPAIRDKQPRQLTPDDLRQAERVLARYYEPPGVQLYLDHLKRCRTLHAATSTKRGPRRGRWLDDAET